MIFPESWNELEKSEQFIAVHEQICLGKWENHPHSLSVHEKYRKDALFNNELDNVLMIPNAQEMDLNSSDENVVTMGREFLKFSNLSYQPPDSKTLKS